MIILPIMFVFLLFGILLAQKKRTATKEYTNTQASMCNPSVSSPVEDSIMNAMQNSDLNMNSVQMNPYDIALLNCSSSITIFLKDVYGPNLERWKPYQQFTLMNPKVRIIVELRGGRLEDILLEKLPCTNGFKYQIAANFTANREKRNMPDEVPISTSIPNKEQEQTSEIVLPKSENEIVSQNDDNHDISSLAEQWIKEHIDSFSQKRTECIKKEEDFFSIDNEEFPQENNLLEEIIEKLQHLNFFVDMEEKVVSFY